jgi:pimeloyl-ACP methyl ester carboxylesterase
MGPAQGATNVLHTAIAATAYTSVSVGLRAGGKLGGEALHQVAKQRHWEPWSATANGAFLIGALNGFAGDRLDRRRSALSHEPQVWRDGQRAAITSSGLRTAFPHASGHLVVFLHGLSETEQSWRWTLAGRNQNALTARETSGPERLTNGAAVPGPWPPAGSQGDALDEIPPDGSPEVHLNNDAVTYGDLLESDHGCTPIYFRYNTGRHIASNGADISSTLDDIVDSWPVPVERIDLIGHSMGGLVTRATLAAAHNGRARWLTRFGHAVYLGTPHTGSPVARFAHKAGKFLEIVPVLAPFSDLATHTSESDPVTALAVRCRLALRRRGRRGQQRTTPGRSRTPPRGNRIFQV